VFLRTYVFPLYDPSTNPKHEFDKLALFRQWNLSNCPYMKASKQFNRVFQREIGGERLDFFEKYEEWRFDYNLRSTPEVELDRSA
jgi:hypothetical protein